MPKACADGKNTRLLRDLVICHDVGIISATVGNGLAQGGRNLRFAERVFLRIYDAVIPEGKVVQGDRGDRILGGDEKLLIGVDQDLRVGIGQKLC